MKSQPNRVAILDAGGQYVDLVRKAVERLGVPAQILPLNTPINEVEAQFGAIIISGSPASSHAETAPQPDLQLWQTELPLLGICYGMQAMVVASGGAVATNAIREDGRVTTKLNTTHPIFNGVKPDFTALFTHGDFVKRIPQDYKVIGQHQLSDGSTAYSAIFRDNQIGVQFHPEVFDDTPEGFRVFQNFLAFAGLRADPKFRDGQIKNLINSKCDDIRKQVGNNHVIAFVSGGVDSSVAATLAAKVIPAQRLHAFYIDSGFMRIEDDEVIEALHQAGLKVKKINASHEFLKPLKDVVDPEEKRKIIGRVFVQIQNRLVDELKLETALLLQGTNAADRIESGHSTGDTHTQTIKTHHNQVHEVRQLKEAGLLVEPIDDLFKDEVRELGRALGLPDDLVDRQPFPGPGLAIRIICSSESADRLDPEPKEPEIQKFVQKHFKTNAHLLPIRSVGVGGDERSHLSVAAIQNSNFDGETLAKLGSDLPAHFRQNVNRVIYALLPGELHNFSLTKTLLQPDTVEELRHADHIVYQEMHRSGLVAKIKQFPVVLLPLDFGKTGQRSIVLRPVNTSTFMTVQAMLPGRDLPAEFLPNIAKRIKAEVPGVSQVFLDLTNKPPATTEWE